MFVVGQFSLNTGAHARDSRVEEHDDNARMNVSGVVGSLRLMSGNSLRFERDSIG